MQYLDIKAIINSNYFTNSKRLNWHIDHSVYDRFTSDLDNWLRQIQLPLEEKEVFDISRVFIFTELASYLTHVYDFLYLSDRNIMAKYSEESNIYIKKIWNREVIETSLLIELEKNRFKRSNVKLLYSFLFKFLPKKYVKNLLVSSNELAKQYLSQRKGIFFKFFPQYFFQIDTTSSVFSTNVSWKICEILIRNIESEYFTLNKDHKESIRFILEAYIARAYNNLNSYSGFLSGLNKDANIITGTGNSYYNRLISSILKKEGLKITRFNHGGERCFFNDSHYWEGGDLFQTDKYITYGRKWKDWLELYATKVDGELLIQSIGSIYHKKFYNKFFYNIPLENKKILYIPNSFRGEIRLFPNVGLIDPILFDWQKHVIEILQKNGFEVIYKKHPKGLLHDQNFLGELASYESTKPMFNALEEADMVLCDMAGSAFIESMCAGKKIVLINTIHRPFDKKNKEDLHEVVKIVDAYWENNILNINEGELVAAFENFKLNKENMRKVVNDYFLSHDD
jgi:hypothetical protein